MKRILYLLGLSSIMSLGHSAMIETQTAQKDDLVKYLNQYVTYDLEKQDETTIAQLLDGIDRKTNASTNFDALSAELASIRDFSNDEIKRNDSKAATSLCYMAFSVQSLLNANPQYENQFDKTYGKESFSRILNAAVDYKVAHWDTCQNSYSDWKALVK